MIIFCDFDGTVTVQDVVDLMLETFAGAEWKTVEEAWKRHQISARECLDRQLRLVRVTQAQLEELLRTVRIDPYFRALAQWAQFNGIPLILFSDGFDWIISRVLAFHQIDADALGIRSFSSHLEFRNGTLSWNFPFAENCAHGCGTCKPELIRKLSVAGATRILIGDGQSDCAAAEWVDRVFAKGWLQRYCRQRNLPCQPIRHLRDVVDYLGFVGEESDGEVASL
jgi:2,3-diketo-5-methylthio-1-phosphopentane phosphatase